MEKQIYALTETLNETVEGYEEKISKLEEQKITKNKEMVGNLQVLQIFIYL